MRQRSVVSSDTATGGAFDSDGIANGVIVDPPAVGDFNAAPSAPALLSPDHSATGLGETVDFKWNTSTKSEVRTFTTQ